MKVKYFPILIFSLVKSTSNLPCPEQQKKFLGFSIFSVLPIIEFNKVNKSNIDS